MKPCKHTVICTPALHKTRWFMFGCFAMLAFVSCSFGNSLAFGEQARVWSVQDIYEGVNGKIVKVHGRFDGWSPCSDATVLKTRSDWTLTGEGRCIHVTGKRPKQARQGEYLTIKARIMVEDGKTYLRYLEN